MNKEEKIKELLNQVVERKIFSGEDKDELLFVITGEKERLSFPITLRQAKYLRAMMLDYYAMKKKEKESPARVEPNFYAVSENESCGMFDLSSIDDKSIE